MNRLENDASYDQRLKLNESIPMLGISKEYKIKHSIRLAIAIPALCLSILFGGCAATNHGSLARSQDVTRDFETFQVFADHRYYYLNQENDPYAVVALQDNYRITDPMWREFDPNSETFEKVVGLVEGSPVYFNFRAYGSYILDKQGNRVGYWYSSLRAVSINVDSSNGKVSINTEKPWIEDHDERFIPGRDAGIRFRF